MKKILSVILIVTLSTTLVACSGGNNKDEQKTKKVSAEENISSKEDNIENETNTKEMLEEILSWYVGDIWNNFVDFDSFRTTGKDCTGSEIDIEFAYKNFKKEYETKDKYNTFINSLPNDYSELKEIWSKMNEQIEKIYNDLEGNGVSEGGENLELDLLSQYDDSFTEIINELE